MLYKRYREESETARMVCVLVRMSIVAFSHSLAVNYQLAYCLMFCRWKKKKHWNSLEGQWFLMLGRFQILTGHSSPRSKKEFTTPQFSIILPKHPWLIKWFISSCTGHPRKLQMQGHQIYGCSKDSKEEKGGRWWWMQLLLPLLLAWGDLFSCVEQIAAVQELLNHSFWF